ncbi:MAG TPA: Hsp20/alpha crystallin family protein [Anaerolineaceae bacterium]|nr:Hsp20/alpha crystallin family protein [Anaerolineaceae bacterium]
MITVQFNPNPIKRSRVAPDEPPFLMSGVVNWRLTVRPHVWRPPTDIYETEDRFIVRVEIAGMAESEFSVTVNNNTLEIRGSRSDTPERRAFHQMEIHYGEFSIEVEFPGPVDLSGVEAEYNDGFLRVSLPKAVPRQIRIGD